MRLYNNSKPTHSSIGTPHFIVTKYREVFFFLNHQQKNKEKLQDQKLTMQPYPIAANTLYCSNFWKCWNAWFAFKFINDSVWWCVSVFFLNSAHSANSNCMKCMYSERFSCVKIHFGNKIYMQHLSHMCRRPNHPPLFSNIGIHIHFRTFIVFCHRLATRILSESFTLWQSQSQQQQHQQQQQHHQYNYTYPMNQHTPNSRLSSGIETTRSHRILKR